MTTFNDSLEHADADQFTALVNAIERGSDQTMERIRAGYPPSMLKQAARFFGVPVGRIRALLLPSDAAETLSWQDDKLDPSASEGLWRLAQVACRARECFQDDASGAQWLRTPHRIFDWKAPLEFLETEPGATEVRVVLNAMATGGAV